MTVELINTGTRELNNTYPETLLSVSNEIPLRDSGGGDITGGRTDVCYTQNPQKKPT